MKCPNCSQESPDDAIMCADCRYPFSGSAETKARFIASQVTKASDIGDSKEALNRARWILLGIGSLTIVAAVLRDEDALTMGIDILLGVIFILFGIFIRFSPVLFTSVPLGLLLLLYTFNAIEDPSTLIRGLGIKALIIGGLIYAIRSMVLAERYRKESDYLNRQ